MPFVDSFEDYKNHGKEEYISLVDEYRRFKYFKRHKKFKNLKDDIAFELLIQTVKHMFKIKRDIVVGIEFGLKIKDTYAKYHLTELDLARKLIKIEWNIEKDEYYLTLNLKQKRKNVVLYAKQMIHRQRTFFGIADMIGVIYYKIGFKDNIKIFEKYILKLIEEGQVPACKELAIKRQEQWVKMQNQLKQDALKKEVDDLEMQAQVATKKAQEAREKLNDPTII